MKIVAAHAGDDVHGHFAEGRQHRPLRLIQGGPWCSIDDAEAADGHLAVYQQRGPAVIANARLTRDQRVVGKARVQGSVQHFQWLCLENGVGTE